ncbi:unnamed protein product, partial [Larinioides sclopetarius]
RKISIKITKVGGILNCLATKEVIFWCPFKKNWEISDYINREQFVDLHTRFASFTPVLWNSSSSFTIPTVMNSMISVALLIALFCCTALAGPVFPYAPAAYAAAYGKGGYYAPLPAPVAAVPAAPALPAFPARFAAPAIPAPAAPVAPAVPAVPAAVVPEYYPYPATAALNYLGYPYRYPYYSYPYGAYVAPYKK